jgi:hypothetical protein
MTSIEKPIKTFSQIDLASDITIVALLFLYTPIVDLNARLIAVDGFFAQLGHLVFLFLCLFACTFMYFDAFLLHTHKRTIHIPKALEGVALLFVVAGVIFLLLSFIAIIYSLFTNASMPTFSAVLLSAAAIYLGIAFGQDLMAKQDDAEPPKRARRFVDRGHSLSGVLPYFLTILVFVFPAEYYLTRLELGPFSPAFSFVGIAAACVVAFFVGQVIEKMLRSVLIIAGRENALSASSLIFFSVLSILSLGLLQSFLVQSAIAADNKMTEIGALFLFGFIPIRVFRVLFAPTVANAILGAATLTFYFLRQFHAI